MLSSPRTPETGAAGIAAAGTAAQGAPALGTTVGSGLGSGLGTRRRIPVAVQASDPLSRDGAVSQLRGRPEVEVREEVSAAAGTVALLIEDTLDEAALARLRRIVRSEGARAVLVVGTIRETELLDVIECGVGAIVWRREATAHRLVQAVLAAHRGDGDLPADLLGRLISQVGTLHRGTAGRPGAPSLGLAPREVDVLRLVAEGLDTGEIASKLSYSERTVKNVMHGLTTRLHLRNRAHAVAYALREGYI
ncbi:LuxR C-terminal-related transcriptional regulator [Streptomyces sp. NPDC060000]|uniref:helix-turn-helix transcriptional regulator n=1 Tax=Streptomyces sp. NPDC060000 TaxID=3347031 RepID=UPI0036CBE566